MKKLFFSLVLLTNLFGESLQEKNLEAFIMCSALWENNYKNSVSLDSMNVYNAFCSGLYMGVVSGVINSINNILFCLPNNYNNNAVLHIVSKYIENHSEKWSEGILTLVVNPLKEEFPCK
jgi:hypothetical protein